MTYQDLIALTATLSDADKQSLYSQYRTLYGADIRGISVSEYNNTRSIGVKGSGAYYTDLTTHTDLNAT